jgi:glycerol-3-phosphate dehydrogenase subunit B
MAGTVAALAARSMGAQVLLVSKAPGATALSSGGVDVAHLPRRLVPSGSWSEAAGAVAELMPHHPYGVLKRQLSALPEALSFAAAKLGILSALEPVNRFFPTPLGAMKPAAMAQATQWGSKLPLGLKRLAAVELALCPGFSAERVAAGMSESASALGESVHIDVVRSSCFNRLEDVGNGPHDWARRLDAPGAAEALAEELARKLPSGTEAVLLPPLLGSAPDAPFVRMLSERLKIPCGEWLSDAPSVPGLRLHRAMEHALKENGVRHLSGEVKAVSGRPGHLLIAGEERAFGAIVLATGKFIGGGIVGGREWVEPLFGLPVYADGRKVEGAWAGSLVDVRRPRRQPLFGAGVRVDGELRPLVSGDKPLWPQLFAAGSVLSGYDAATDRTGLGVAIFTGFLAGQSAAQCARQAASRVT